MTGAKAPFVPPDRPPDWSDCHAGPLHADHAAMDPASLAQAVTHVMPGWFRVLFRLRQWIAGRIGLDTGNNAARPAFPVISADPTRCVMGLADRHLDFVVELDTARTGMVSIATRIWFNAWYGRVYLWIVLPAHNRIIRHWIRYLGQPITRSA